MCTLEFGADAVIHASCNVHVGTDQLDAAQCALGCGGVPSVDVSVSTPCACTPFSVWPCHLAAIWAQIPPAVSQRAAGKHIKHLPVVLLVRGMCLEPLSQSSLLTLVAEPVTMTVVPPMAADLPEN